MRNRDIDASLLRAFVAIVDAGSFGKAARQINRTQSAVSLQIKRLEEVIDAPVFDRSARPAALTPAGEALVPYARHILSMNDAAVEHLRADRVAGRVRLGLMEDFASTRLGPIVGDFLERYPGVQVEVETGVTSGFVEHIGERFDMIISMTESGVGEGELLHTGRSIWGAAPGFTMDAASSIPLALYPHGCLFRKWAVGALDAADRRWRIAMLSGSLNAVANAVRSGWCISVFKACLLPPGLEPVSASCDLPKLPDYDIRLVVAPNLRSTSCRRLADFLRDRIPRDLSAVSFPVDDETETLAYMQG